MGQQHPEDGELARRQRHGQARHHGLGDCIAKRCLAQPRRVARVRDVTDLEPDGGHARASKKVPGLLVYAAVEQVGACGHLALKQVGEPLPHG